MGNSQQFFSRIDGKFGGNSIKYVEAFRSFPTFRLCFPPLAWRLTGSQDAFMLPSLATARNLAGSQSETDGSSRSAETWWTRYSSWRETIAVYCTSLMETTTNNQEIWRWMSWGPLKWHRSTFINVWYVEQLQEVTVARNRCLKTSKFPNNKIQETWVLEISCNHGGWRNPAPVGNY